MAKLDLDRQRVTVLFHAHPNGDPKFALCRDENSRLKEPEDIMSPIEPLFEKIRAATD